MKLFRFFAVLFLCLCFSSCGTEKRETGEILGALMDECSELPRGVIYTPHASEGEEGYMSAALAEALWGEDAHECFALLSDYSVYLSSFATPYEIGVFRCYSSTDAIRIEQLCRARADIVSVAVRQTEYHALCSNIRIVREGDTVIFMMTDRPDRVERRAKRLI